MAVPSLAANMLMAFICALSSSFHKIGSMKAQTAISLPMSNPIQEIVAISSTSIFPRVSWMVAESGWVRAKVRGNRDEHDDETEERGGIAHRTLPVFNTNAQL